MMYKLRAPLLISEQIWRGEGGGGQGFCLCIDLSIWILHANIGDMEFIFAESQISMK